MINMHATTANKKDQYAQNRLHIGPSLHFYRDQSNSVHHLKQSRILPRASSLKETSH